MMDLDEKEIEQKVTSRKERQTFWTFIMNDESMDIRARLRASELLAKSEGDFVPKESSEKRMTLEDLIMASQKM
jgi:hypothetical protein